MSLLLKLLNAATPVNTTDTAHGGDVSSLHVALGLSDTGHGLDASTFHATYASTDASTSTSDASTLHATYASTDSATDTELAVLSGVDGIITAVGQFITGVFGTLVNTHAFPVTAGAAAGDLCVIALNIATLSRLATSATDTQGNTWHLAGTFEPTGGANSLAIFYSVLTTALTTSDTITVNLSGTSVQWSIIGVSFHSTVGWNDAAIFDVTATNDYLAATAADSGSVASTKPFSLVVGAFGNQHSVTPAPTFTKGTESVAAFQARKSSGSFNTIALEYYTTSAIGTQDATGTWNSADANGHGDGMLVTLYDKSQSNVKTPKNTTDTGSGSAVSTLHALLNRTDASATSADASTLHAAYPRTDTSNAGTDASTLHTLLNRTDAGSGADVSFSLHHGTDAGSGADASTEHATYGRTDTGSGADVSTEHPTYARTDIGSGADVSTLHAVLNRTDTGSGADASGVVVPIRPTDTGSGAAVSTLKVALSRTDTGSGADVSTDRAVEARTDTGTGADVSIEHVSLPRTDTGSGAAASHVVVPIRPTDSAVGVDVSTIVKSSTPLVTSIQGAKLTISGSFKIIVGT